MTTKPKKPGRPSSFTEEIAETICTRLVNGDSLRKICAEDAMPDRSTVFRWLEEEQSFATKYARARELQAHFGFEELQEIADEGNPADVQRARLRADTLRWRLSKLFPKKYGDKVALTGGDDGDAPVKFERIERIVRDPVAS